MPPMYYHQNPETLIPVRLKKKAAKRSPSFVAKSGGPFTRKANKIVFPVPVNAYDLDFTHPVGVAIKSDSGSEDSRSKSPNFLLEKIANAIMTTKLTVSNLPNFRKSTLALHRINSMVNGNDPSNYTGHEGFDDLRAFIKAGGEFNKELVSTLADRAELEATYAKGLQKLATRLFKASNDLTSGTVSNAWHFIAEDMASTADTHKTVATLMTEDLVKPLKSFADGQHKSRKSVETLVDKKARVLQDWRLAEVKTKSKCHSVCKDNERVQDAVLDCKLGRGRVLSDKELMKLDTKRKKSEEALRKGDLDYYSCCLKSERARLEWESSVLRGCTTFRRMEEDRLDQLRFLAEQYHAIMEEQRPKLVSSCTRLDEPVRRIEVSRDMDVVRKKVEIDENSLGEQNLPQFYAEDINNCMNRERRREALAKVLRLIKADVDRENKGMAGVENLAKALQETPKFGGEESQQDVQEKLQHMRSMLTFLEAARFKVLNSMLEMEGRPKLSHPLADFIENVKDKSGSTKSVLRLPYWNRQELQPPVDLSDEDICIVGSMAVGLGMDHHVIVPPSPHLALQDSRGTADGGFADLTPTPDFTTTVIHSGLEHEHDRDRGNGEVVGAGLGGAESSDFDEFSDGDSGKISGSSDPDHNSNNSSTSSSGLATGSGGRDRDGRDVVTVTTGAGSSSVNGFLSGSVSNSSSGFASGGQEENEISEIYYQQESKPVPSIGQCRALYDYSANMYDELSIRVGDIINVHDKQEDGWWLGEIRGQVGIFPATYVEDIPKKTKLIK